MDTVLIVNELNRLNRELEAAKKVLKERGHRKAVAKSNYDKQLTLAMLKIKNGMITEFEGVKIESTSYLDLLAKGYCWKERLESEEAEAIYKAAITGMEAITTQIRAYQSIFKHQDSV